MQHARFAPWLLILLLVPLESAKAIRLRSDALGAVGGPAASASHRLGSTTGLAATGVASGSGLREVAGFWRPAFSPPIDVPEGPVVGPLPTTSGFDAISPNPAVDVLRISFRVAGPAGATARTRIDLFDLGGRRVARVLDRSLPPGPHTLLWNEADVRGHRLGAGLYYLRLRSGSWRESRSILIVR